MPNFFILFYIILIALFSNNVLAKANIKKINFDNNHNIEIIIDKKTEFKTYSLIKPDRIVVDLKNCNNVKISIQNKPTFIEKVRYGKNGEFLRIVFDLKQKTFIQSANYQQLKGDKYGKVIVKIAPEISYVIGSLNNFSVGENKSVSKAPSKRTQIPIIVIDAGHGGKDPGAIGQYARTKEKDLTLSYAKELARQLNLTKRYKVYLTRNSDIFIPLKGRVEKARKVKADLFISLHANSAPSSDAKGFSIYTLSEKASDKESEKLARKENMADVISGVNYKNASSDIIKTLIDLSQRSSMNHSARFANIAIQNIKRQGVETLHNTHRFAGFMVLTAPDMVSILIELGYLTNKIEEKKLNSLSHKRNLVKGLVVTIDEYFQFKK